MLASSIFHQLEAHNKCCLAEKSTETAFSSQRIIKDFDNLADLNFNCNETVNVSFLELKPNNQIVLDDKLNFKGLKIKPTNDGVFSVMLNNFKGFSIKTNPFNRIQFIGHDSEDIVFNVKRSNFDFYYRGQLFENNCNQTYLDDENADNILKNSFVIILFDSTLFSQRTCPLIFKDTRIRLLNLRVSTSFVSTNELKFQKLPIELADQINSRIVQLDLTMYHSNLSSELFDPFVFKYTSFLDINGQVNFIQKDMFKTFSSLKILRIKTQSIRNIFSRNNKWLEYLNYETPDMALPIDRDRPFKMEESFLMFIYQAYQNLTFYDFPDEDFCHFKNFPHKKLVLPKMVRNTQTTCSCTQLFLIQYSFRYSKEFKLYTKNSYIISHYYQANYYSSSDHADFSVCVNDSIEQTILNCDFEKRIEKCNIAEARSPINDENDKKFYFYLNDWQMLSNYGKFYLSVYFSPIFSFFAIFINALLLVILSNKTLFKDNKRIYRYLRINAYLNISFIAIFSVKIVNNCKNDDLFCSSIYDSVYVAYYNIIFIKLIGNTLQTASNLAHVSFSLSRYIFITQTKSKILKLFDNISIKLYLFITLVFSLLMNAYICFEFDFTRKSFNEIESYIIQDFNTYKNRYSNLELTILNSLQYIKIFVSDIAYIIGSAVIDLILLFFLRKRKQIKDNLNSTSAVANLVVATVRRAAVPINKTKTKDSNKRITNMITFNGINFVLLRLPFALVSLYGLVFYYNYTIEKHIVKQTYAPNVYTYLICRTFHFCDTLEDFFFIVYISSFSVQFLILLKFDKNFKQSFNHLKTRIKENFKR